MLFKVSLSSFKKLWKDYLVLLFGLIVSISIFYMFMTLAMNRDFLQANSLINSIMFVFIVGAVILSLITIVYIFYAISFILTLRQKELGMYMMLGAKKSKVTRLIFFETMSLGVIAIALGIVLGIGLAMVVADMMMQQIGLSSEGFYPLYVPSMLITFVFYITLFFLTALMNAGRVASKSVLALLQANQIQERTIKAGAKTIFAAFLGLVFLLMGYTSLVLTEQLREIGVLVSTFATTAGTYLLFMSLFPLLVNGLKKNRVLNEKGLNAFTLAQLRFRAASLTRVLGTVAMLIALGLGALAGGLAFYHNIVQQSGMMHYHDVIIHDPVDADEQALNQMQPEEQARYRYKMTEDAVYLAKEELVQQPPKYLEFFKQSEPPRVVTPSEPLTEAVYTAFEGEETHALLPRDWLAAIQIELNLGYEMVGGRNLFVVEHFAEAPGDEHQIVIAHVDNYLQYEPLLLEIEKRQMALVQENVEYGMEFTGTAYGAHLNLKVNTGGTIFMGFFLGVAFLLMMASVLMFKLLSSGPQDKQRYEMLRKIGVSEERLSASIYKELFPIFAFPGLVGILHVIVGMNLFQFIVFDPYEKLWIPIAIFMVIYGLYYYFTVMLYKRIVLPKEA
ncbi:ABC transporter permease [Aureibacillus halotolerans]|uniref:Putative ABC transport system permease protein n=1 Tax=Aureibacillus halotolerans TaxID=1508390 RepID=A0A4R6U4F6_9BACI|nr:FtsX-like permease family protein [Aureibacillus halotolerans]TDQ41021.1 putative ABC transport system permease protein [Aureibacillus halotolerans]